MKKIIIAVSIVFSGIVLSCLSEKTSMAVKNTSDCYFDEVGRTKSGKIVFDKDVTGDDVSDRIEVKEKSSEDGSHVKSLFIKINGKEVKTLTEKYGYGETGITVNYIHLNKKMEFLQFIGNAESAEFNYIYRYNKAKNKFVSAIKLDYFSRYAFSKITSVKKNGIQIEHENQPIETGLISWRFYYVFKGGKLCAKSLVSSKVQSQIESRKTKYNKYFKKNQFISCSTRTFYKDTGLKKSAFVAKRGNKLKLNRIKIDGKKMYLQFQKGKKKGWQRVCRPYEQVYPNLSSKGWFLGVKEGMVS